jgi:seryl-tRNA synthetase
MSGEGNADYEAVLPYNDNWIEFQNLSVNGEKYPKGFTVKSQSGEALWSGCGGVGLGRWASAFLSQMGLDRANWPEEFLKRIGKMPKRSGSCEPDPQLNFLRLNGVMPFLLLPFIAG